MSKNSVFEEKYKKLNKAQKEAVDTIEGPVMVIAGPGTGKTTILTLRIANILKETDSGASGILALTFTDAGVKVMRKKLREIIGSTADEVRIHTFHSFAGSVIAEFPEHFTHIHRATQITDVEAESLLREILKDKKYSKLRPLGDADFYLNKILSAIGDAKKEAWTPEIVRDFAKKEIKRIENDEDSVSTRGASKGLLKADALKKIEKCERTVLFADVYAEYESKKTEERKIDFDDLLYELLNTLKKDELLLRLLQEKFLYILVDEHQDTNDSQNMIVSLLANFFETPNLFVVGDEKQAIYRFQGASVENFLKFQNIWKDMKVISLGDNYRSHQDILDAVFSMIEKNYEEGEHEKLRVKLKSPLKTKKPIDLILTEDTASADAYLLDELKRISKLEPEKTVAVILRWNRDIDHVLSICEKNGISISAERGADIFSHPLGVMYFKLLEYLVDNSQTESLAFTLGLGLWGLSLEERVNIIKKIRSGNLKDITLSIPKLSELNIDLKKSNIIESIILVGEYSGLVTPERMKDPLSVEVWRGIVDLSRDIAKSANIEDFTLLAKKLLDYKKTSEGKTIKIGVGRSDSKIHAMTAHSSKGLEYDYVFIPYALEEYWMRRPKSSFFALPREKDTSDEVKDSRRLFYVALTRAREHVVLIIPEKDNLGRDLTELRFVGELADKNTSKITMPKVKSKDVTLKGDELREVKNIELLDYAQRVLQEKGLSVTALNHFLKCPSEFLYKSILKIPEAPNASSEKGIAMHKAFSEVWRSEERQVSAIKKIIEKVITNYIENSLLHKHDKQNVLLELLGDVSQVAKELESHFNQEGKVFTEKWVETSISYKYGKSDININLHGQLDAILDTDKQVLVFDYKTKEGMSENAIKGETKNDDGNYWRQLIFYKILLEKDYKNKSILPSLVFVRPDSKGRCPIVTLPISNEDVTRVRNEINTLLESVYSGAFLIKTCDDKECEWCALKKYSTQEP